MNLSSVIRFARRFPVVNFGPLWTVTAESEIRQVLGSRDFEADEPIGYSLGRVAPLTERWCSDMESTARQVISWEANALAVERRPFELAPAMRELSERLVMRCLFGRDAVAQFGPQIEAVTRRRYRQILWDSAASLVAGGRSVSAWARSRRMEIDPEEAKIRRYLAGLRCPTWLPAGNTDEELADLMLEMFVATTETTAAALTWLLGILGGIRRPDGKFGDLRTFEPDKAIDAALGIGPAVWFIRRAAKHDTLIISNDGDVRFGREVKAGDQLFLIVFGMSAGDLAFGRSPAEPFSRMVMRLVLEEFGARFRLDLQEGSSLRKTAGLYLWPRRVIVKVEDR